MLGLDMPIWGWLLIVALILFYWHGTSTYGFFKKLGIPFEMPMLPYLGNIGSTFTKSIAEDELDVLKRVPGKVIGRFVGRTPTILIADASIFKQIMVQHFSKFRNRRSPFAGEETIFTMNIGTTAGDHWKHVRSILVPTFSSGKLKQMFPVIENCADKLVRHLKATEGAPFVIKDYTSSYTMDVIASTAFGLDIDARAGHPFVKHANILLGMDNSGFLDKLRKFFASAIVFTLPQSMRVWCSRYLGLGYASISANSVQYFEDVVNKIVADLEKDPSSQEKNLVGISSEKVVDLKKVDDSEIKRCDVTGLTWTTAGLTRGDFIANSIMFIIGGHEATATSLQFFLYMMTLYPDIQQQLYEEIQEDVGEKNVTYEQIFKLNFLDWCLSETLRLYPPGLRIDRVASEDVTIDELTIPKGMQVFGLFYAMNHDPDIWPDPYKFDPTRFDPENLTEAQSNFNNPFGGGPRSCIAMRLALLEVKLVLVRLLQIFKFEKCGETTLQEELKFEKFNIFLLTEKPLKISAVPR
ncbi:cytochrome P450 3A8-like [Watersipora subatra]|uniref:cytochrome P450 3A8-like n=1 Tax=Watersipora subatra TaxID=2589382 RepID=UPI00355BE53F